MPELERLAALHALRILDTAPEPAFDQITALAARLFATPIALVTLVDDRRQWFKSKVGLDVCETRREEAFCAHALALPPRGVMVVENAPEDPRFADNPLVTGPPHIRFYAGALLSDSHGHNLGTLCVIDTVPRDHPSPEALDDLRALAGMVVERLEHTRDVRSLAEQKRLLTLTEAISGVGQWRRELKTGHVEWSDEVYRIHGVEPETFNPDTADRLAFYHPDDHVTITSAIALAIATRGGFEHEVRLVRGDGAVRLVLIRATTELDEAGQVVALFGVIQDVTDRREALESVRRSQSRYKLLADNMADVVTRIALDGSSSYISPAIKTLLDYTPREMAGRSADSFVYEPDRPVILNAFAQMAAGRDEMAVQHRAAHRDGHPVWVETRFRLIRDEAGQPAEMVAVIRDISEQKSLEAHLQASEARARRVIADARQAIVTIDEHDRVTDWNRLAETTFGWTAAEALGASLADLVIPPEHRAAHMAGMERFLKTHRGVVLDQRIEMPALRKSGEVFPLELSINAIDGPEGWQFTALMQDITERRAQMELFENAFNHASIGMALVTPDGRFSKVNDAFCGIVDYPETEVLKLRFQDITHPDDLDLDLHHRDRLLAGDIVSYTMDKRYIRGDGTPVWVNLAVSLVRDRDDQPLHFIAQAQDLTARVEAQEALEQQAKVLAAMATQLADARDAAEAANNAKAEFLANMSHELRTPLNGVIGFSRLLAQSPDLSAEDRRRVLLVRGAGEALNGLINDVLDFSKLEARAVELEARPFSVGDMVSEALSMVEPQAADKRVRLAMTGDHGDVVIGDKYRLRQVLLNLLSNAVKFTQDGTVTVDLEVAELGEATVGLKVRVIDQGVGIPADKIGMLFKRFSQADGAITRTFGGTGLGLAISRELIELMGGDIGVESMLGEGSTFWFEVVLQRGILPVGHEKAAGGRAMFPGKRVLVCDDVALNRELCQIMVEQHGCAVDLASDGAEAVAAVLAQPYDLVLMDVHMPNMDGLAATTAIRDAGFDRLPILALSASGTPQQVEACLAAGMNGHLLKPLAPADLERALASAFAATTPVPGRPEPVGRSGVDEAGAVDADREAQLAFEESMGPEATLKFVTMLQGQLEGRFTTSSREALIAEAHKTAGSAGLLGLHRLGNAASRLEACGVDGDDFEAALAALKQTAAEARDDLSTWAARLERGLAGTEVPG